jgi:hypothetical protein
MSTYVINLKNDFQDSLALAYEYKNPIIVFHNYIPENVRKYIFNELRCFENILDSGTVTESDLLLGYIARDIANIRRLAGDERMKSVYQILNNSFFDNENKIEGFIESAWSAHVNFSPFRKGLKKAKQLNIEIAETAEKLAFLLTDIGQTGVRCPYEFFEVDKLLDNTNIDNILWQTLKPDILGLIYPWEKAPSLPELLITLSKTAKSFNPSESGFGHNPIDAAISSNKSNPKTEYLRAFSALLDDYGIELTPDIMKAIAITATVIIDSPDIDVSYGDVSKAIAYWKIIG